MRELTDVERLLVLEAIEEVQVGDLARTRRWIATIRKRLASAQKPPPPPAPVRDPLPRPPLVTQTRHDRPPMLHGPDCWIRDDGPGTLAIDADSARQQLAAAAIEPCDLCHPEAELEVP